MGKPLGPGFLRAAESFNRMRADLARKGITMTITPGRQPERESDMGKTATASRPRTTTRNGLKVDKKTGEVLGQTQLPVDGDFKKLERDIADAYGELVELKEAKDSATAEHKEGQDRLNALVGELYRRVNGEQPLPLK